MSPAIRRFVLIVLAGEIAVCGWLVMSRLARPRAAIPASFPDDPLLAGEFAELAKRAEHGGPQDWLFLGESLLGQGCYGHAEQAFARALQLDPGDADAAFALGFAVDRTGRMAEANAHYERCLDISADVPSPRSKKPFALYAIGRNHLRRGDVAAAEAAFLRNEGFVPALYQLARILHHADRPKEAAELLAGLLGSFPLSLELHQLRARVMERLGEPAAGFAAAVMEERSAHLIETSFAGDFVRPFTHRHGLKRLLDEYEAGKASGDRARLARELDAIDAAVGDRRLPQRMTLLYLRGERALVEGKPGLVPEIVRRIAAGGDASSSRLVMEAASREQQGDADGARPLRERALLMSPTAVLERQLAADCDRRGDTLGRDRHVAAEQFLAAMVAYRRNRPDAALELLRKSAALVPDDATTWFHIGEMEYHLGRRDAAAEAFRTAVELRPGYGRGRDYLAACAGHAAQSPAAPPTEHVPAAAPR